MEQEQEQAGPPPAADAEQQDDILQRPILWDRPEMPLEPGFQQRPEEQPDGLQHPRPAPQFARRQPQRQRQRRQAGRPCGRQHNRLAVGDPRPKEGWFCPK